MGLSNPRRVPRTVAAAAILVVIGIPVAWGAAALVTGANLSDLQPAASAFDGASAKVTVVSHRDSTTTVLRVHGVGASAVGKTYGAHLHEGMCVAGDGSRAGGHYNHTKVPTRSRSAPRPRSGSMSRSTRPATRRRCRTSRSRWCRVSGRSSSTPSRPIPTLGWPARAWPVCRWSGHHDSGSPMGPRRVGLRRRGPRRHDAADQASGTD